VIKLQLHTTVSDFG